MNYRNELPDDWPKKVALDIETTGLDPHQTFILSVAVADVDGDTWLFLHHEFDFTQLIPLLEDESVLKIIHNAKFEISHFKHHLGCEIRNLFDTYLAEKILIGGRKNVRAGLGDIMAERCGVFSNKEQRLEFVNHPGFDVQPPTDAQIQYMLMDVLYLHSIKDMQVKELKETGQVKVAQLEFKAVAAFAEIELNGFQFDVDLWYAQAEEMERLRDEAEQKMRNLLGEEYVLAVPGRFKKEDVLFAYTPQAEEIKNQINVGSPQQLKAILADYGVQTKSTAAPILEEFVEMWREGIHERKSAGKPDSYAYEFQPVLEFVEAILEYRKWVKRLGYDYPKYINPVTGRIHPEYHQMGTATGRVSCSNPNMQQVPRPHEGEPNMRHLFIADTDDYVVIRADYSQQEPRVMAQLCGDANMIKACNSKDVYIEFGKIMYGKDIQKGSEERQIAKMFVLAKGFGAGIARLAYSSGLPEERVREVSNAISRAFPKMVRFAGYMERFAKQHGYVATATGRRRYAEKGKPISYAEGVNTPVQGTAADMFKAAAGELYWYLTELKKSGKIDNNTRLWHVVHDEIEVMCHKDEVDFVGNEVQRIMEESGRALCPDVAHIAEWEAAYRWDK